MNLIILISIDLPSLQSIILGYATLDGSFCDSSCSLVMRSMNQAIRND